MVKAGYMLLLVAAAGWVGLLVAGLVETFPAGVVGLCALLGVGVLFIKVFKDRLGNREDDYYSKNVHR